MSKFSMTELPDVTNAKPISEEADESQKTVEHASNLDIAQNYAQQGIAVRPSEMRDVVPSVDPKVIHAWWNGKDDDVAISLHHHVVIQVFPKGLSILHQWEDVYGVMPETYVVVDGGAEYPSMKLIYSVEESIEGFCDPSIPIRVWGEGECVNVTGRNVYATSSIKGTSISSVDCTVRSFVDFLKSDVSVEEWSMRRSNQGDGNVIVRQGVGDAGMSTGTGLSDCIGDVEYPHVMHDVHSDCAGIQTTSTDSAALSAEHYQSYGMAKTNDGILGGDDIAQIRSYAAYARAQAQALHKTIAAMNDIDDVTAVKSEALETEQTFAKVGLYADQRVGEILRELPKAKAGRKSNEVDVPTQLTKGEAIKQANIDHHTAIDLQAMAANPEMVQMVIDKAEAEGRVASRKQVLDAINERKRAERERDMANEGLAEALRARANAEMENVMLKRKLESIEHPKSEVIDREVVREVVPPDYNDLKRKVDDLRHENGIYLDANKTLRGQLESMRKELDQARDILGMDESIQDVRRDVQYLIIATNSYVRRYGGLTWTVERIDEIDAETREQFRKSILNLATFATALTEKLDVKYGS